jgi:nucleotide-binding universal stress UspA family protein
MPFLKQAREVLLAQVAEGDPKAAAESAADVVRFLMRHGVRARAETREAGRSDPAHAVVELAREFGADLVVSGAYGHSRLREWAFGGMTRSLLRDDTVHRLLSN